MIFTQKSSLKLITIALKRDSYNSEKIYSSHSFRKQNFCMVQSQNRTLMATNTFLTYQIKVSISCVSLKFQV